MKKPAKIQLPGINLNIGRPMTFPTPDALLEAAYKYFDWANKNPWLRNEALKKPYERPKLGKNGQQTKQKEMVYMVQVPTQRPYSLAGFGVYHGVSQQFILDFEKRQKEVAGDDKADAKARANADAFLRVISHVRDVISSQQLEGATVGTFNANIVARILGLVDKKDLTTGGESMNKGYYDFLKERKTRKTEDNSKTE